MLSTIAALPLVAGLSAVSLGAGASDGPLNVLFVMDDQHNAHALGMGDNGFGGVSGSLTPSLDALAAEGVRFTRAYCDAAQCVPARVTLLTGRRAHHHGTRFNDIWEPQGLLTLPKLARRFGYATGTIGKHHLSWLQQPAPLEEDAGFDEIIEMEDYNSHCFQNGELPWIDPSRRWQMPGLPGAYVAGYTTNTNEFHPSGYFADRAIDFLDDRAGVGGDDRPFVLWLSFFGPHDPILPTGPPNSPDWAHLYHPYTGLALPPNVDKVADQPRLAQKQAEWSGLSADQHRELLSYYYGSVSQIDWNVGRVLGHLDTLGLAERTVVVFTADHGEAATEMSVWGKGFGGYESIRRVPLILRLPGALPPGLTLDATAEHTDLFPTLVELLGLTTTRRERSRVDGRSLLDPIEAGGPPEGWPDAAFGRFGNPITGAQRHRSVATATRKYIHDEKRGGYEELFDLELDPWERTNLVGDPAYSGDLVDMRQRLADWWGDGVGHAPLYSTTGNPTSPPPQAAEPDPPTKSLDVARDTRPRWVPATSASTQILYLGTAPDQMLPVAHLGPMVSRWNPGVLEAGTKYWWSVEGTNANGVTPGPRWTFTTGATPDGPRSAVAPAPADDAEDVSRTPTLSWTPGAGVVRQHLWFAPVGEPLKKVAKLPETVANWSPPLLDAGRTYRWRLDGEDQAGAVAKGSVWRFTVDPAGLPSRASQPAPCHLETGVSLPLGARLTWTAGGGATAHDVYFGTELPLRDKARVSEAWFEPGPLVIGQRYYWRVDEVGNAGVTTGFTWRFTASP